MIDTKALRQRILDLAIKGKLVPQDPNDEPASVLLEKIRAEKQKLIKEGKIKKDKNDSVIFKGDDNRHYEKVGNSEPKCIEDELPFDIPDSWVWSRLGSIFEIARGGSPRPIQEFLTTDENGVNWIKISDTQKGGKYINSIKEKIKPAGVSKSRLVHKGDFLLTNSMSFGRPYILNVDGCIHDGWLVFSDLFQTFHKEFLYYILSSHFAYTQFIGKVSGAVVKNLNSEKVADSIFPLPPLAEQQRIVAKIERLFAQIDIIEQSQKELETLYSDLKKKTLDLAIRGKLVPQYPNDEPASVLIDKIRAERRTKLGKKYVDSYIYKGDDNCYYEHIDGKATDTVLEVPFDLPNNWAWARLLDLGTFSSGKTPNMSVAEFWDNGNVQWFTSKDMKKKYLTESQLKITELAAKEMTIYPTGTLLWVVRSGILTKCLPLCILTQPSTINQDLKAYQLNNLQMSDYIYFALKGFERYILENYVKKITTVHSLKFDDLTKDFLIPLPPLAEQQRIVDKINEIFEKL